jgi:hypothetical protein
VVNEFVPLSSKSTKESRENAAMPWAPVKSPHGSHIWWIREGFLGDKCDKCEKFR